MKSVSQTCFTLCKKLSNIFLDMIIKRKVLSVFHSVFFASIYNHQCDTEYKSLNCKS